MGGEKERRFLKDVVKAATFPVKSRIIPQEVIQKFRDKIAKMETDVDEIIKMEQEEKELRISELQMNRAQNKLEGKPGRGDLDSAPQRTWFQTKKEREAEKANQRL